MTQLDFLRLDSVDDWVSQFVLGITAGRYAQTACSIYIFIERLELEYRRCSLSRYDMISHTPIRQQHVSYLFFLGNGHLFPVGSISTFCLITIIFVYFGSFVDESIDQVI